MDQSIEEFGILSLLNSLPHNLDFSLRKKPFENIVGKGENAGNQHFLLFPQGFLALLKTEIIILATFNLLSANAFNLDQYRILSFGKDLNDFSQWASSG